MSHTCHAHGCAKKVPAAMLMCFHHWSMVPKHLKKLVWQHYRPGQERTKDPSAEYLAVAREAINAVWIEEMMGPLPEEPYKGFKNV